MLLFCPTCSNVVQIHHVRSEDEDGTETVFNQIRCRTCPYQFDLDRVYMDRKPMKRKKVDAVADAEESAAGVEEGEMQCPNTGCDSFTVRFYQVQIRSADEPMTTFYTCTKCKHRWREN